MSEWIGRVGRLRPVIYTRLERLSFRTGAATVSGVLAVAVTAILLTLVQPGHHAVPKRAAQADPGISSVAAPAMVPFSLPPTHRATRKAAAPFSDYRAAPAKRPKAAPQSSPSVYWLPPKPQPRAPSVTSSPVVTWPGEPTGTLHLPTPSQPYPWAPEAGPASGAH